MTAKGKTLPSDTIRRLTKLISVKVVYSENQSHKPFYEPLRGFTTELPRKSGVNYRLLLAKFYYPGMNVDMTALKPHIESKDVAFA